jgi:hypothetical protein
MISPRAKTCWRCATPWDQRGEDVILLDYNGTGAGLLLAYAGLLFAIEDHFLLPEVTNCCQFGSYAVRLPCCCEAYQTHQIH